jgi:hypothetical protein
MIADLLMKQLKDKFGLENQYQSNLDSFITSKNPKGPGDIERLIREYERKIAKGFIL